jgi:hypothetical protein
MNLNGKIISEVVKKKGRWIEINLSIGGFVNWFKGEGFD